jgi:hypothetical protein
MRKLLKLLSLTLLMWGLAACTLPRAQGPATATAASVAPTSAPALQDTLETTSNDLPTQARLGQMQVNYPVVMLPGSSKTVNFSIYIPAELAEAAPESFKREVLPPESPRPLGKYSEYNSLILIEKRMRVELVAPGFALQELYPAEQELDLSTPLARTNWGWTITAPAQPNEYVLVLRVFSGNEKSPSWVGSFDVVVEAPTATPAPAITPLPSPTPLSASELILKNISDNAVTLIGTLLTTLVAILGLYLQYRKPKPGKEKGKK